MIIGPPEGEHIFPEIIANEGRDFRFELRRDDADPSAEAMDVLPEGHYHVFVGEAKKEPYTVFINGKDVIKHRLVYYDVTLESRNSAVSQMRRRKNNFTAELWRDNETADKATIREHHVPNLKNIRPLVADKSPEHGHHHKKEAIGLSVGAAVVAAGSIILHYVHKSHSSR